MTQLTLSLDLDQEAQVLSKKLLGVHWSPGAESRVYVALCSAYMAGKRDGVDAMHNMEVAQTEGEQDDIRVERKDLED